MVSDAYEIEVRNYVKKLLKTRKEDGLDAAISMIVERGVKQRKGSCAMPCEALEVVRARQEERECEYKARERDEQKLRQFYLDRIEQRRNGNLS